VTPRPKYLVISKAGDYQHYRTRRPPWVKLHRHILDDKKLSHVTPATRWLFLGLVLLTSEESNRALKLDQEARKEIARRLNLPRKQVEEGIKALQRRGFICLVDASTAQAFCTALSTEHRGTEEEKKTSYPSGVSGSSIGGVEKNGDSADSDISKETKLSLLEAMMKTDSARTQLRTLSAKATESNLSRVLESARYAKMRNPDVYILAALRGELVT
jgi:hypothetical protein